MGEATGIQWTQHTYNPWMGCARVSPGCDHCYMFREMRRYGRDPDTVTRTKPPTFNAPRKWNRAAKEAGRVDLVFMSSWTDFFIRDADPWRDEAWAVVRECDHLVFQILTKRHGRIARCLPSDWGAGYPNVWLGVTAEDRPWWDRRVGALRDVPALTKFVSYEPALGSLERATAHGIDWVIIGGESGGIEARPFDLAWARTALAICRRDGAKPFVKQLGAKPHDAAHGRLRLDDRMHGGDIEEWPSDLRVREMPEVRRAA